MPALAIAMGPACGALSVGLAYRASVLVVSRRNIALGVSLLFAFMSPLFPYSTSVAHYSHVYLTCVVALIAYVGLRMVRRAVRRRDAVLLALALVVAIAHRAPAALYSLLAVPAFFGASSARARITIALGTAVGVLLGVGVTASLYRYLYGTWIALPQGPHYVHLAHAHPWLLLFGVHGGFFFWMPAAWLAVLGLVQGLVRRPLRGFALASLVTAFVEVLVSASPLDWHGNWSLGARRLLPLTPLVILFASIGVDAMIAKLPSRWPALRPAITRSLAAVMIVLVLVNNIPASTTIRGDRELSQRELYGALSPLRALWSVVDDWGLDLALLPAEAYFVWRYGLPSRVYRDALEPRYRRQYRDLSFSDTVLDLRSERAARLTTGAWALGRGLALNDVPSRLLFTAEWPFATHVRLLVSNVEAVEIEVSMRDAFHRLEPLGRVPVSVPLAGESQWVEVELPKGAFSSGINEVVLATRGGHANLAAIGFDDRTLRVPHGEVTRDGPERVTRAW
jgi:hypothetical protein